MLGNIFNIDNKINKKYNQLRSQLPFPFFFSFQWQAEAEAVEPGKRQEDPVVILNFRQLSLAFGGKL